MSRLLHFFDIRPKSPLLLSQLGLEDGVGPPHGLDLEKQIDLLQRHAARFGNEEEGKEESEEGQSGEEEVDAVAHGGKHLLGEARDEEVEEPVGGGGGTAGEGTEVGVEEFRVDDPWRSVPRGRVDGRPEVKEEDGRDAASRQVVGLVLGGLDHADVGTNDPHANGTGDGTAEEEVSASELVDEEEEPDKSHDSLDDAKDAGHEVDGVVVDTNA